MSWLAAPFVWLARLIALLIDAIFVRPLETKTRTYHSIRVADLPDEPNPFIVYIAGEGPNVWAASLVCPCGCEEIIELNLLPQARPRWSFTEHKNGAITLEPSVWRRSGCRSHFILRDGLIHWCR